MRVLISPRLPKYFKCGHSSHVIPLIETIPYLSHALSQNFFITSSLALDNWGQKYFQTFGYKPKLSIPIVFDRSTFKFLENCPASR